MLTTTDNKPYIEVPTTVTSYEEYRSLRSTTMSRIIGMYTSFTWMIAHDMYIKDAKQKAQEVHDACEDAWNRMNKTEIISK